MLKGKNILLGITGGIAAYKSAYLVRELTRLGANVQVILTRAARDFVTPLTLSTLSGNPVYSDFQKDADTGTWVNHVELANSADAIVVAPATANTLAKLAHGHCDELLLAVIQSAKCHRILAPAMDLEMWQYPPNRKNVESLGEIGFKIIEPTHGELASGLVGQGRMEEPEKIAAFIESIFNTSGPLSGKRVVITAGPTREAIDPVRYLSNRSSGKMGYALAQVAASLGAQVDLISGPTQLDPPRDCNLVRVESASEMYEATMKAFPNSDFAIFSAAVSDFAPKKVADEKIKKDKSDESSLELSKTMDILAEAGKQKNTNQCLVGFALETENEEQHAQDKLKRKNLDYIVLNSLRDDGAGFSHDTNKVTVYHKNGKQYPFPLADKLTIAKQIWQTILPGDE